MLPQENFGIYNLRLLLVASQPLLRLFVVLSAISGIIVVARGRCMSMAHLEGTGECFPGSKIN